MRTALGRPAARVAASVTAVLLVPLVAMAFTEDVSWTFSDFAAAAFLLATVAVALELAVKRAGSLALAAALAVLGVLAALAGNADDAPGLVLLGLGLVAGAVAVGARSRRRA
jgi:hypothetical protein